MASNRQRFILTDAIGDVRTIADFERVIQGLRDAGVPEYAYVEIGYWGVKAEWDVEELKK